MRIPIRASALAFVLALTACALLPQNSRDNAAMPPTATTAPIAVLTEAPEYRYAQLLDRDDIRPIYEPEFVPAGKSNLDDEELVLAVAIDGQAKAYPIRVLNYREMVNDELAGIPILATW